MNDFHMDTTIQFKLQRKLSQFCLIRLEHVALTRSHKNIQSLSGTRAYSIFKENQVILNRSGWFTLDKSLNIMQKITHTSPSGIKQAALNACTIIYTITKLSQRRAVTMLNTSTLKIRLNKKCIQKWSQNVMVIVVTQRTGLNPQLQLSLHHNVNAGNKKQSVENTVAAIKIFATIDK